VRFYKNHCSIGMGLNSAWHKSTGKQVSPPQSAVVSRHFLVAAPWAGDSSIPIASTR